MFLLLSAACSSSTPRDQNFGSDSGRGFDAATGSEVSDESPEGPSDGGLDLPMEVSGQTDGPPGAEADVETMDVGATNLQDMAGPSVVDGDTQ